MGPTKKGGETHQTTGGWTPNQQGRGDRPTKKARGERGGDPQLTRGRETTNQQGRGDDPTKMVRERPTIQQGWRSQPRRRGGGRDRNQQGRGRPFNQEKEGRETASKKGGETAQPKRGNQEREVKTAEPKSLRSGGATFPLTTNKGGETSHVTREGQLPPHSRKEKIKKKKKENIKEKQKQKKRNKREKT